MVIDLWVRRKQAKKPNQTGLRLQTWFENNKFFLLVFIFNIDLLPWAGISIDVHDHICVKNQEENKEWSDSKNWTILSWGTWLRCLQLGLEKKWQIIRRFWDQHKDVLQPLAPRSMIIIIGGDDVNGGLQVKMMKTGAMWSFDLTNIPCLCSIIHDKTSRQKLTVRKRRAWLEPDLRTKFHCQGTKSAYWGIVRDDFCSSLSS